MILDVTSKQEEKIKKILLEEYNEKYIEEELIHRFDKEHLDKESNYKHWFFSRGE